MGTSSGFIGVCQSVAGVMGNGVVAYGAIMAASFIGGLFETVLGSFLKPLRKFFPSVVTGTVVLSIGLSLLVSVLLEAEVPLRTTVLWRICL
jgi:xanthine/uracil permease